MSTALARYEIFETTGDVAVREENLAHAAYLRENLAMAKRLGLTQQANIIQANINAAESGKRITTRPMTDDEITIWQAWLPMRYTTLPNEGRRLAEYRYDRIPGPVLKMWDACHTAGIFERYEIWTPERDPDPVLIGVHGNDRHFLARWGESDANLVSFDDIKRELRRRWELNHNWGPERNQKSRRECFWGAFGPALAITIFITMISLFLLMGLLGHQYTPQVENMFFFGDLLICAIIGIGLFTSLYSENKRQSEHWHENWPMLDPLLRAITRDNERQSQSQQPD